jgi:hypothetical protein
VLIFFNHSYLLEIKADFPNLFKDNSQPATHPYLPIPQYDSVKDGIETEAERRANIY